MNLNKKFIDANLKRMNEEAISKLGTRDGCDGYMYTDDTRAVIEDISDSSITINLDHPKIGFFSFDVKLDEEDLISLLEMCVKKMNKFKTILETLK